MVFPVPPPWGCSSLLSHSPFVRKKQGLGFFFPFLFFLFFFFRGKFHCAIFSGDNLASRNNFILLPALPAGAGGCLWEQMPRDAETAAGLRCAGRRGLPPSASDQAPPALHVNPRRRPAQPGCSTWPLTGDPIDSISPG